MFEVVYLKNSHVINNQGRESFLIHKYKSYPIDLKKKHFFFSFTMGPVKQLLDYFMYILYILFLL